LSLFCCAIISQIYLLSVVDVDDAIRKPENANYTVDVLTRCVVTKDGVAKKKIKVVPLKEPGEPLIVSIPIDQVGPIHYSAV
jgi:ATP-dependent RNA helicase DOB1